jgi:hypothetical protein
MEFGISVIVMFDKFFMFKIFGDKQCKKKIVFFVNHDNYTGMEKSSLIYFLHIFVLEFDNPINNLNSVVTVLLTTIRRQEDEDVELINNTLHLVRFTAFG